jgi:dopamine beta-monooxygenase
MDAYNFHKRILLYALVIFIGLIFSLALFSTASSRPFRIGRIPDKGKGFGCATCHINSRGGGARNSFGSDYEKIAIKAGEKYTEDLGKKDSDGDGFTNDREFEARTHPGDLNSKP